MIRFRGDDLRAPTLLLRGEYQASGAMLSGLLVSYVGVWRSW